MKNEILQHFYERMLPRYTPQAEKFLDTAQPSAFNQIAFRYTFSVEAMTKVSHIIEDAALTNRGVTDLHVSFQYLSRLVDQQARYTKIADATRGLWIYAAPDAPPPKLLSAPRVHFIDTAGTLLVDYWFVAVYGPGLGMSLLAEEISALDGSDRYYEGFYTFEADVAYQLIDILHQIYPDSIAKPLSPDQLTER